MSYRSIKRYLGETNLERKCRIFFGICLLLLISVAFWRVDVIAESLVKDTTRHKGRDLADIALLQAHFEVLDPSDQYVDFIEHTSEELKAKDYRSEILKLDTQVVISHIQATTPSDEEEINILRRLQQAMQQRKETTPEEVAPDNSSEDLATELTPTVPSEPHIYEERPFHLPTGDEYHYYTPIRWHSSCRACHSTLVELGAISASEGGAVYGDERPLHVVKVAFPYKETRDAINKTRAILGATGIATFFVSMLGLYVIVRYVIVKPLKHMRDVSDDISRGKTELRAELHTGDEFEDLANSFNRMLRHLTDTQGELRQVNKDLDSKVDELAQLNMRLHEMNRLKSEFLANMSHELRTPLNSIIGFSEVLQGIDSLNGKQKRYAENIQQSGRVLLEMINDILDLAKMEAGKMEVRPTEFDIQTVISAHCDMVRALSEDKNIDLEVHIDDQNPPLFQDQAKFQRILTNLLSNAIKFTPEGGRITVSARAHPQQWLELVVADTGVGIADEDREIIFEKFRQGPALQGDDNLTREYSGTGLGLSLVKELCKLLGGEVSLESQLGKGSTFKVVLPWVCPQRPLRDMEMESKLDELGKLQRDQFPSESIVDEHPVPVGGDRVTG